VTFQTPYEAGLDKSLEVREQCGFDFKTPLSIYDVCDELGVAVRFTNDVSMEGVYVAAGLNKPTIILSALRPLSRRTFTCGHEIGHHVFGDGTVLDELEDDRRTRGRDIKELRADSFAGHFLMPLLGVAEAFTLRGWRPEQAEPAEVYAVACNFGVGYTTLVHHMNLALHLISPDRAETLLRAQLPRIRQGLLGHMVPQPLLLADRHFASPTLDSEVGTLILVPAGVHADPGLEAIGDVNVGTLFRAAKPGIFRAYLPGSDWAVLVRVSRQEYHGLARYRHLEEADDDVPVTN
jgi:hypothetical protein